MATASAATIVLAAAVLLAGCQQTTSEDLVDIDSLGRPAAVSGADQAAVGAEGAAATGATGATVSNNVNLDDYILSNGDRVQVRVFNQDTLTGEYQINGAGRISLPLVGDTPAAGKTADGVAQEIRAKLQDGYLRDPQVSVEVVAYRPLFVLGAVTAPGSFEYVSGMTVQQAIAMAGGLAEDAEEGPVIVTRGSTGTAQRGTGTMQTRVFPGDTIEVPKERSLFVNQ